MARKARSKKKKSAGVLETLRGRLPRLDPASLWRAGRLATWALVLAGLALAWGLFVPGLRVYAAQQSTVSEIRVRFAGQPAWMKGELQQHLARVAATPLAGDPLRRDDLVASREALMATGWFTDVRQVRRREAGQIEVDAVFAQPCAVVRDHEGDHVIDATGRLLPLHYEPGQAHRFLVIRGTRYRRPDRPGQVWEGADLVAALRLKRLIDARPWREQVTAIDAGEFQANEDLYLVTDRGHRIRWGRPPGEEAAGEVTAARKLYYLDYPFEHQGHIDGGYDGELDITDPRGVFGK